MTLRRIAKDLYHLQQEVDRLEKALRRSGVFEREAITRSLAEKIRERNQMRTVLDGHLDR